MKEKEDTSFLEKIYKVSRKLRKRSTLKDLLTYVLDSCIKIAGVENGSLMLLDDDGRLFIAVAKGLPEEVIDKEKVRIGERISGWVAKHKEILFLGENDERFTPFMSKAHIKTAILLPLEIKGRVLGVINLSSTHPIKDMLQDKKRALLVCTTLAAAAIMNQNLQERMKAKLKRLQHLVNVTESLSFLSKQEDIIRLCFTALSEEVEFDVASLLLCQEKECQLSIYSHLSLDGGLLECVKEKCEAFFKEHISREPQRLSIKIEKEGKNKWKGNALSAFCFPLISRAKRLGLLCLYKEGTLELDEEACSYLHDLTSKIAIAWENNQTIRELQRLHLSTIKALITELEVKSPYTKEHSERVAKYAIAIGKKIGMDERSLSLLEEAALLHDVGKIGIDTSILNKPARLTEEEFESIKLHPIKSENIVRPLEFLFSVLSAIRHHHERWNGEGYPDRLKKEEIPLEARIIAVADTFDALCSARPYRPAFTIEEAKKEIAKNAGKQFDPFIVKAFLEIADTLVKEVKR